VKRNSTPKEAAAPVQNFFIEPRAIVHKLFQMDRLRLLSRLQKLSGRTNQRMQADGQNLNNVPNVIDFGGLSSNPKSRETSWVN
jgi:hypothetical protein